MECWDLGEREKLEAIPECFTRISSVLQRPRVHFKRIEATDYVFNFSTYNIRKIYYVVIKQLHLKYHFLKFSQHVIYNVARMI